MPKQACCAVVGLLVVSAVLVLVRQHIEPREQDEIASAMQRLGASDSRSRVLAAKQLRAIGRDATEAVPRLIDVLQDQEKFVRQEAAVALISIDPEQHALVIPVFLEGLRDPDPQFRWTVVRDIGDAAYAVALFPCF